MDKRFDHIDRDFADLRTEVRDGFAYMRTEFRAVRSEINDLRLIMIRFQGALLVAMVGVIAAILARGV
jgi:hypothetical protein